jgi:transcriptional regulator with XRE-family HTH domain
MPNREPPDSSQPRRTRSFSVSGPLLRSLRAGRGWTQGEVAAKAGFSDRLIRKAEAGGAIDAHSIATLARLYSSPERRLTPQDLLAEPLDASSAEPTVRSSAFRRPAPSVLLAGKQQQEQRTSPMEELVHRWFEQLWIQRRLKVINELAAPGIVLHAEGRQFRGRRSVRRRVAELHAAFSDFEMVIDELTVRDDLVICRWRLGMTHTGPWHGWPATSKRLVAHGCSWSRIEGGLICECWDYWGQQRINDAM